MSYDAAPTSSGKLALAAVAHDVVCWRHIVQGSAIPLPQLLADHKKWLLCKTKEVLTPDLIKVLVALLRRQLAAKLLQCILVQLPRAPDAAGKDKGGM